MSKRSRRKPETFVLLGISGSGKGTQAEFIRRALRGSRHISTGEGLRRMARKRNLVGRYISAILRRGGLIPYWAPSYIWLSEFLEHLRGDEPLIFDGAPRRLEEAELLDNFMRDVGRPLPVAVHVRLSPRLARVRLLKRGRSDDTSRAIRARFRFFETSVRPVIAYYQRHHRLITVNGAKSVPGVWREIRESLRLK